MILAAYSINLVQEINDIEPYPDYYANIIQMKIQCDYDIDTRGFLKYWANCFSYQYVGHDRIIPIISSVVVVYLTYVLANLITGNRIIGLISMGAMSLNPLLTKFDSSPTYDQLWAALFLLSIVLLYRKPVIGILAYPISIMAKILAVGYLPAVILTIITDKKIIQKKLLLVGFWAVISVGIVSVIFLGVGNTIGFYPERILDGLLSIFENIWVIFPAIIGAIVIDRFFISQNRPEGKKTVLIWLACILLTTPILYIFTESQYQFGYRFVPFAAFFSVYLGIVCVQLGNFIVETRLRKQSLKSIS